MFRLLYKAIFKAATTKGVFVIKLQMSLKYEISFTLEYEI